jgi:hypothetical protein
MYRRSAVTLIETLVVLALVGVLLALLAAAIQKARSRAMGVSIDNNLRQIALALHNYASLNEERLPGVANPFKYTWGDGPVLGALLPFVECPMGPPYYTMGPNGMERPMIKVFLSPTDPSLAVAPDGYLLCGPASYAANRQVFSGSPSFTGSVPDGLSNTIAFAEHYFVCMDRMNYMTYQEVVANLQANPDGHGYRGATFADPGWVDVYPITGGVPPVSRPSTPGVTFQVAPKVDDANGRQLQASQTSGLAVAMLDGSVHRAAPSVSPQVFWAAVTPAGEELDAHLD